MRNLFADLGDVVQAHVRLLGVGNGNGLALAAVAHQELPAAIAAHVQHSG